MHVDLVRDVGADDEPHLVALLVVQPLDAADRLAAHDRDALDGRLRGGLGGVGVCFGCPVKALASWAWVVVAWPPRVTVVVAAGQHDEEHHDRGERRQADQDPCERDFSFWGF